MFAHAFDTLKIPDHRFGTRDTPKKVICLSVSQGPFSCYAIFKWIWTYKTHDLTDYQLNIGSFLPAITFMWSDRQIPRWPQFFQQPLFPSVPSLVDFNRAIISRLGSFHIDFLCAHLATPVLSYRFFQIFVAPVVWSILEIAVLRPPWFVSIVQSFFKASSSSSRVRIRPLQSLGTIWLTPFAFFQLADLGALSA